MSDTLRLLNDLLVRVYDQDETSLRRVEAALAWFQLLNAERRGVKHYEPHPVAELGAHEALHAGHVANVMLRRYAPPLPIPPDEKMPPWGGRSPEGWRPPTRG